MITRLSVVQKFGLIRLLEGMMFWFGIEQLFMNNILQNSQARAYATTGFVLSILLTDAITGWFADIYGRKKSILIGISIQLFTLVLLANSRTVIVYAIGSFLWGVYWSFSNSAIQAYLYDYLKEQNLQHTFAKQAGRMWAYTFAGATIANASSGFIANSISLQFTYILSLAPALLAFLLARTLHEQNPNTQGATHTHYSLGLLLQNLKKPRVILYGLRRMLGSIIFLTILEFGQLYLLSYGIGTHTLGLLWSLTAIVCFLALLQSSRAQQYHEVFALLYAIALLVFGSTFNTLGIVLFFVVYAANELLSITTETEVQHELDSQVRTTVLSIISFIGYGLGAVCVWIFNNTLHNNSVRYADSIFALSFATLLVISVLLVYLYERRAKKEG